THATGNLVQGNYIGTDSTGALPLGNGCFGIFFQMAPSRNTIGGTAAGAGNVISANAFRSGIVLTDGSHDNLVQGHRIGTHAAGTAALGNGFAGVLIGGGSVNNTVGGTAAAARNLISGNGFNPLVGPGSGILITDPGTQNNLVQGNYLGTDITGTR